jgi:hypothetical protein
VPVISIISSPGWSGGPVTIFHGALSSRRPHSARGLQSDISVAEVGMHSITTFARRSMRAAAFTSEPWASCPCLPRHSSCGQDFAEPHRLCQCVAIRTRRRRRALRPSLDITPFHPSLAGGALPLKPYGTAWAGVAFHALSGGPRRGETRSPRRRYGNRPPHAAGSRG